jgi:peptidoglycan/LPS O-acetylase OafA/YrhL
VAFHFREALPPGTPGFITRLSDRGYLAVDLFFILSGYVIALNYGRWFAGEAWSARRYGRFLALRLSRIYPLHLVMLLLFPAIPLAAVLFSHRHDSGDLSWGYYALSFLLMQGWGIVSGLAWNVPAWSISTEWFAYLAFPLLALGVFTLAHTRLRATLLLAALLMLVCAVTAWLSPSGLGYTGQFFGLFRCLTEFSAGICIFRLAGGAPRTRTERTGALILALLCFTAFATLPAPDFAVMPLGFAALVHGLSDERGRIAAMLRAPALQWLGVVSYSTYLSHYFLKAWVKFILVRPGISPFLPFAAYIVAVLLASAVLYRLVERPGQQWLRARFRSDTR